MGANKTLARPGRKQATGNNLGIYSTFSPWSSIHFSAHCSNFSKPLKKKEFRSWSVQTGLRGSSDLRVGRKIAKFRLFFSVQGTGDSPVIPDPENGVGDQDTGSPSSPVSSGLHVPGDARHCRASTRPPWWAFRGVFPSNCPSFAPVEMINIRRWFGPLEDNKWRGCRVYHKKYRRVIFRRIFALVIFWGGENRYAATSLIFALSPGRSDITRFRTWSSIATGNHLDRTEKFPEIAQTTRIVDVFDPRSGLSGPISRRESACPNLHEWWTQPAHLRCSVGHLFI